MTQAELGFILLTSRLGDPERRVLSPAQVERVQAAVQLSPEESPQGEVTEKVLLELGLPQELAARIPVLLEDEARAAAYIAQAERLGLRCVTRHSPDYPAVLHQRMGPRAPGVLWIDGNCEAWNYPRISLIGSRDLRPQNLRFAREAGIEAAAQGYTLVSGSAIGADTAGQNAALEAGGYVISVLPDRMGAYRPPAPRQLYIWEDSYDLHFSAARALSRNHIIHALGEKVLVAQVSEGHGGTWNGSIHNLQQDYCPLFVYRDGSRGAEMLIARGGIPLAPQELDDLRRLSNGQSRIF